MSKPKMNIEMKVQKEFPEFVDEVAKLSDEEVVARLVQLTKDGDALEQAKEADEGLEEAQNKASELAAPYRDGRKVIRLKSRYLIAILKEKGA